MSVAVAGLADGPRRRTVWLRHTWAARATFHWKRLRKSGLRRSCAIKRSRLERRVSGLD